MAERENGGIHAALGDLLKAVLLEAGRSDLGQYLSSAGGAPGNVHLKNFQVHMLRAQEELLRGQLLAVQEAIRRTDGASAAATPEGAATGGSKRNGKIEIT
jgi:hypothetical protein